MASNWFWNGKVFNRSNKWVICLWDDEENGKKVWKGKGLGPGRRSPTWLDVDGVIALDTGVKISGILEWWWLSRGAEVKIQDLSSGLYIQQTSTIGGLKWVYRKEINSWEPSIDRNKDVSWGQAL